MAIDVAALYASLGLDYRDFVKGTKRVKKETRSMEKGFGSMGKSVKAVGAAMGVAFGGAQVLRGISAISRLGVQFDQTMRQVKVIARATGEEFTALTAIAEKMGSTTEYTSQQSAEALKFLSMAGLEAAQSIKALPQVLNLATAAQMDLATAADISTNIMTQMGLRVDELTRVNDALSAVQSTANTNVLQAAEAFVYAGTKARQFGVDTEELAAMVGMLANSGIKATMAGTTLRQAMLKLLAPTGEAAEILKHYNIQVENADGGVRSFTEILYDLADANLSTVESAELFGARAGNISVILDQGKDKLKEYIEEIRSMEGFSEQAATELRTGLWGVMKNLDASIEHLALKTFKTYEDSLMSVVKATTYYVDVLGEVITKGEKVKGFLSFWAKYVMRFMPGAFAVVNTAKYLLDNAEEQILKAEIIADKAALLEGLPEDVPLPGDKHKDEIRAVEDKNKLILEKEKRLRDDELEIAEDWLKEKARIGKTDYEIAKISINEQYKEYKKVVRDIIKLEQWKSDQLRQLEMERMNETIAFYTELYEKTGFSGYAEKAKEESIKAYQGILDAQSKTLKAMGIAEYEIKELNELRMDEYVQKLKDDFKEIEDAEQKSADNRVNITKDMLSEKEALEASSAATISSGLNEFGIAPREDIVISVGPVEPSRGETQRADRESRDLLEKMGYYTEEQVDYLTTIGYSLEELVDWSRGEARRDIDRAKREKTATAQQQQEKWMRKQTEAFETFLTIGGSIDDLLDSLMMGPMAPAQSVAWYQQRYEDLLGFATSPAPGSEADAVSDFLQYVPEFLQFMGAYGVDYATLFTDISQDLVELEGMYDLAGLLAGLGFGDTISELEQVIDLLGMGEGGLGYTLDQMAVSAITAAAETGLLSDEMAVDLLNAMGALSTEITAGDGTVVSLEDFLAGTENLGDAFNTSGGASVDFKDFLIDPTTGLEEAIDETGGEAGLLSGTMFGLDQGAQSALASLNEFLGSDGAGGLAALSSFMSGLASEIGLTYGDAGLSEIISGIQPPVYHVSDPIPLSWQWVEDFYGGGGYYKASYEPSGFETRTPHYDHWVEAPAPYWYQIPPIQLGEGGLTSGLSMTGELGPEWVVPTYEPERSEFLKSVGASPGKIGEEVARRLLPLLEKGQNISIQIDGKELMNVIIDAGNSDEEYIDSIRGMM